MSMSRRTQLRLTLAVILGYVGGVGVEALLRAIGG